MDVVYVCIIILLLIIEHQAAQHYAAHIPRGSQARRLNRAVACYFRMSKYPENLCIDITVFSFAKNCMPGKSIERSMGLFTIDSRVTGIGNSFHTSWYRKRVIALLIIL